MKKIILITLVLLILFFFIALVRTVGLFNNNALFLYDSARDFLYVSKIAVDHKPLLIGPSSGGLEGYFHGVLWYYLLVIPFIFSGGDPISGPWFMAIASSVSVLGVFFVLKRIMNIYAAFLGVLFLGFAEFSIATTKFIWNPYPIVWLMPFYFWGIYLIAKRSLWGIFIISAIHGLILHFEVIYGMGILPAYLFILIVYLKRQPNLVQKLKHIFIALLLLCIPFLPSFVFDLRHQFLISKAVIKTVQTGGGNITHNPGDNPKSFPERIQLRFNELNSYSVQSVTKNVYFNYLLFGLLLFGIFKLFRIKKDKEKNITIALAISVILSPFFVFLLLRYSVWGYYWIGTASLYVTLLAFAIGYLAQRYKKILLFIILTILIFFFAHPWSVFPYWYKGDLEAGTQVLSTQIDVVKTIYKDAGSQKFSAYQQTPPVYDYVYRYLFLWQGSKVYNYIPTEEKQKIVYVILEGVPADLDGKFFKKNRLYLTTEPVKAFKFANYPIVEKFITDPKEQPVDPNLFPQL